MCLIFDFGHVVQLHVGVICFIVRHTIVRTAVEITSFTIFTVSWYPNASSAEIAATLFTACRLFFYLRLLFFNTRMAGAPQCRIAFRVALKQLKLEDCLQITDLVDRT